MKKLNMFNEFKFANWQQGKEYTITSTKYNDNKKCVSLDIVITKDDTDYGDVAVNNLYEKFKVHCVQDINEADVSKYPVGSLIQFKQVGKCSIYGDFNSNLSVEAVVQVVNNDSK